MIYGMSHILKTQMLAERPIAAEQDFIEMSQNWEDYMLGEYPAGWQPVFDGEEEQVTIEEESSERFMLLAVPSGGNNMHIYKDSHKYSEIDITATVEPLETYSSNRIWVGVGDGTSLYCVALYSGEGFEIALLDSEGYTQLNSTSFMYDTNVKYKIRLFVAEDSIKTKVWDAGNDEPGNWQLEQDVSFNDGYVAFGARGGDSFNIGQSRIHGYVLKGLL